MKNIKKNLSKIIAIASLFLLTGCGANWILTTQGYDAYSTLAYKQSLRTTTSISTPNTSTAFTGINSWDFGLYSNTFTQCRYHGWHDLWHFDPTYNPFFCRPSQSFLWSSNYSWRPFMGNVHWNYWGNSYWTDPWYNPWWNYRPRVYINGRRGSSSYVNRTPASNNRPSVEVNRGRSNTSPRVYYAPREQRDENIRTRVNTPRSSNSNTQIRRSTQPRVIPAPTNRSTNPTRPVRTRDNGNN